MALLEVWASFERFQEIVSAPENQGSGVALTAEDGHGWKCRVTDADFQRDRAAYAFVSEFGVASQNRQSPRDAIVRDRAPRITATWTLEGRWDPWFADCFWAANVVWPAEPPTAPVDVKRSVTARTWCTQLGDVNFGTKALGGATITLPAVRDAQSGVRLNGDGLRLAPELVAMTGAPGEGMRLVLSSDITIAPPAQGG